MAVGRILFTINKINRKLSFDGIILEIYPLQMILEDRFIL